MDARRSAGPAAADGAPGRGYRAFMRAEKSRIGVQAMMLVSEIARDGVRATMHRLDRAGYHLAEISQVPMTDENVDDFARARDEIGFSYAAISAAMSTGAPNDAIDESFDKIVRDAGRLGVDLVWDALELSRRHLVELGFGGRF